MRLSFSTNAFVRFSVPEAIERIAAIGYSGVEILADTPHLYPHSTSESDLAAIASALERRNLTACNINANTAVGYYGSGATFWEPLFEPSLANPEPDARKWRIEYTKKCIDFARALNCPNVSVTSGRMVPGLRPAKSLRLLGESLDEVLDYAVARDIRIGMEYEPGLLIESACELESLIKVVRCDRFGANLDFGHSRVIREDPAETAQRLGSRIFHVHLEDILGGKHYHQIPGEGDMDFDAVFSALDGVAYDGYITVELYTYPDNPEYAARLAFDRLTALNKRRMSR
ncbi:MAG: sugar phosphate isomerase/epimerase [Desulfobacteraceae bacterium]|nr:sugar phosphate isomerase/epimerase [Desulfobacteraceae bacterium]